MRRMATKLKTLPEQGTGHAEMTFVKTAEEIQSQAPRGDQALIEEEEVIDDGDLFMV